MQDSWITIAEEINDVDTFLQSSSLERLDDSKPRRVSRSVVAKGVEDVPERGGSRTTSDEQHRY